MSVTCVCTRVQIKRQIHSHRLSLPINTQVMTYRMELAQFFREANPEEHAVKTIWQSLHITHLLCRDTEHVCYMRACIHTITHALV